jgi:hypothetical protein
MKNIQSSNYVMGKGKANNGNSNNWTSFYCAAALHNHDMRSLPSTVLFDRGLKI